MQYSSLLRLLPLALASLVVPLNAALSPQPLQFEQAENAPGFALRDGIRVDIATSHSELGRAAIRALMAAGFSILPEEMDGALKVHLIEHDNPEAYTLNVTGQQISIGVATPLALHAAAQTLAQAAEHGQIPAMQVAD
ncbi:MAG: hypothetical protein IKW19_02730, partial [Akkermansia sp.]|nr:hypothetical protein [Akkermansia sp.]